MDPLITSWDKSLPQDVLELVVKTGGGINEMKGMRGVCKTWQQGFELMVKGIAILLPDYPFLPSELEVARRFPGLTKLDLGRSEADGAFPRLQNLRALPKLDSLSLGEKSFPAYPRFCYRYRTLLWALADSNLKNTIQASSSTQKIQSRYIIRHVLL